MNYILHGSDEQRMKQKLDQLKLQNEVEQVLYFDCSQVDQTVIFQEMDTVSIFDEKKMLVLEQATFLTSKDRTGYDLASFLERAKADTNNIVVYCCPSDKLDKRKKRVKELIEISKVLTCMRLDDHSKQDFVRTLCKEKNVTFERDAYQWFISRIGYDPLRIENEIEKCSIYAKKITLGDVQLLVSPEPMDNIFKMVDALFQRNALLLLSYYRNFRALNMEPLAIVGLLASQIRFLFQVRVCMDQGMSKNEIAQEMHAHPYRIQVNMERSYDFKPEQLLEQLSLLADFEQSLKQGLIDKDEGFEQFVMNLLVGA